MSDKTKPSEPKPQQPAAVDAREQAVTANMQKRLATQGGSMVGETVTTGVTSMAFSFRRREFDGNYGVAITPSWGTTVAIAATDKTTTGFTAHFGTAAPAGATIDYLVYRAG